MQDTRKHIKQLQLKIWLEKPPGERLRQFLVDNDALFKAWKKAKEDYQSKQETNTDAKEN